MAPALPFAPRDPPDLNFDTLDQAHRRQVLVSVDNLSEDDTMGLQNHSNIMKDPSPLGDQMLVDLSGNDLLSVIKTLETNNDTLSTGDAESIFPLDLPETVDSESDPPEQKVMLTQVRIERRCAFLLRRLRILQARAIGKRVSEEAAHTFDKCTRGARKDGGGRPMGLKAFLKRVETTATLQASAASHSVVGPKYYNVGTPKGDASKTATVGITSGTLTGLEDTAAALKSHLSVVKHQLDSDATASSSGAESNDEAVTYNNTTQQPLPIEKRALWTWQRERASIASRWCWLQAQVQELDYKIRQHNELHKQVREVKGPCEFEGSPVGYEGSLPGSDECNDPALETCARIRPLRRETFKKRKLLQMHNLHVSGNKASRPADISCSCQYPLESCAVCTGRAEPAAPAAPHCTLAPAQRRALVDPGYHPVLSDIKDMSPAMHMAALCSRSWFRPRVVRAPRPARPSPRPAPRDPAPRDPAPREPAPREPAPVAGPSRENDHQTYPPPRPPRTRPRLKRGRPPLSRKLREKEREEEAPGQERCRNRTSTDSRRRPSFDIDSIVIPPSVAANNRPEVLEYKEIVTPQWRLLDDDETEPYVNNGVSKTNHHTSFDESDDEDVTEMAIHSRHRRAQTRERDRYTRKPRVRRSQLLDDSHFLYDLIDIPAPQTPPPPPVMYSNESIPPYSPRRFPLPDETYVCMLSAMPADHDPTPRPPPPPRPLNPPSPDPPEVETPPLQQTQPLETPPPQTPPPQSPPQETPPPRSPEDYSSTLSPVSPSAYEGDDPDDLEWDPSVERSDRRKPAFR